MKSNTTSMAQSRFEYGKWVEEALREVVRRALEQACGGLQGGHHFYVTFRTDAAGVGIPDYLHAQYPHEMTIALQHQFHGLKVLADHFEVTLSFNRVNENLKIPFASLTAFADPSVNFGLQLNITEQSAKMNAADPTAAAAEGAPKALPTALPGKPAGTAKPERKERRPVRTPVADKSAKKSEQSEAETEAEAENEAEADKKGEVIAFDSFKKK